MGIGKSGLALIGTHAIISIVESFLLLPLAGLWDNSIYQWVVGLILIFFLWIVVYADMNSKGQNDLKRGVFVKAKGFLVGLVASIPALILYIASISLVNAEFNYAEVVLRIWLVPYSKFFVTFEELMPHLALIPIILFPIITGISYLDGPRRREKILKAIEQSDAQRAEKSKVGR